MSYLPQNLLFFDGKPKKDKYETLADNGYSILPPIDTSNYRRSDVQASIDTDPPDARYSSINGSPDTSNYGTPDVGGAMGDPARFSMDPNFTGDKSRTQFNRDPNSLGNYINAGLGLADSLIPGERIHKNYPTTPLPVYNPHPYGTGSQALMDDGGELEMAKSGSWLKGAVNPAHKGYCTPMTKSTCTGHRKAFAERAKHHNLEDGGIIPNPDLYTHYGNAESGMDMYPNGGPVKGNNRSPVKYAAIPYGQSGSMATTMTLDLAHPARINSTNERGYVNSYNAIDQNGNQSMLSDEQVSPYLNPNIHNNFAYGSDSVYVAPGASRDAVRLPTYASGGDLTSDKAKKMLKDGTAQGHKLTPKQKKYFGYIAGGGKPKAPGGTQIPQAPPGMKQTDSLPYTPQSRTDAYLLDDINQTLATGVRTKNTGYNPDQQGLLNDAFLWRKINGRQTPQDNIQGYFDRSVDRSNPLDAMRARLGVIGQGPLSMYNTTPNMDVRNPTPPAASMANGGSLTEGSIVDLPEEHLASLLKAGYRFQHLD